MADPTPTPAGAPDAAAPDAVELGSVQMMARDHARMRKAGTALAEAALYVIREYDGTHRLSLAVADWAKAVADEGDRNPDCRLHAALTASERTDEVEAMAAKWESMADEWDARSVKERGNSGSLYSGRGDGLRQAARDLRARHPGPDAPPGAIPTDAAPAARVTEHDTVLAEMEREYGVTGYPACIRAALKQAQEIRDEVQGIAKRGAGHD